MDRIAVKISYIKEQISSIRELLKEKNKDEILADTWLLKGLKYSLQTAVEAMIDIIYHISAKHFNKAAEDAREGLSILLEHSVIDENSYTIYSSMIGFRNRVVHGYQQVTPERVYEIASKELVDFERFIEQILKFLRRE
ncbi:DUF86 domain-containing protein [Biomaibacter acetigenes]|jgi:uncharacterized protein YutE (UPF0331/DUF86 family)|uniref:DUF86 domain-containing protein n=2 Tax=Biomaibacter acetigenes TaxID=2316383 RepID=A0A3G2RCA5_9FIRM|nr:DUF86 domain-containing protein [Biomaibacter acetigenes]RKL63360.1 DUF86 domain-containing protein [Thermoanaerobacteraceae bacterium SP2]